MKKIIFSFLTLLSTISSFGQTITDGYYRVESMYYKRYMSVLDNTGWARATSGGVDYDLYAIRTLEDDDVNNIMSNPATIVRISPLSSSGYTVSAQGVDVRDRILNSTENAHLYIRRENAGTYTIRAEAANIATMVLTDVNYTDSGVVMTVGKESSPRGRYWYITPVTSGTDNYFGFSPKLQANGKYYQTFYASFPFRIVSSGVKVYYISNLFWKDNAVTREFGQGDIIPGSTPVLVECSSPNAMDNQIQPVLQSVTAPSQNYLRGVFFNYFFNGEGRSRVHNNRTAFKANTMRVLRVTSDGKLAFVNNPAEAASGTYYLPANEAYLQVPSGSASVMSIMSYDDYTTGIDNVKVDNKSSEDDAVYTLSGVRVKDTNNLPHGVYIIGGKKVVK